jgi:hypothetical protein
MTSRHLKQSSLAVIGCAASLAAAGSANAALAPEQFAVGWPLELPAQQGFFDIPLTLEMYQQARTVEGIAVLDANGEPMSFYRVTSPQPATASERRVTLSASPIYAADPGNGIAELTVNSGDRRTNVTVTRPDGDALTAIEAFVIDAREVETAPLALELAWRALEQPFLMTVRIEQSQTLTDWRPVGRGSVAALSIDGNEVRHGRVPVVAAAGGYYRISASRSVANWYLESAALIHSEAAPAAAPRIMSFAPTAQRPPQTSGRPARSDEHTLYFDLGGVLPAHSVTLDFTATNRWATASIESSNSLEGPWTLSVRRQLFYELDYAGEELASAPIGLGRIEARYWRATLDHEPQEGAIELKIEYPQEQLRFAAEGTAPYMLVAGTLAIDAGPDRTFAQVWSQLRPSAAASQAAGVGPRVELGGAAALQAPFEFPWRRVLLWLVLGAGVLAVAAMAVRLARDMSKAR